MTTAGRGSMPSAPGSTSASARGEPGIVSCSALKRAYRARIGAKRQGVRLIYLLGSQDMIASRLAARTDHFMPPALLESQFATLEEPGPEERALVVGIAMPPPYMAASIVEKLGLPAGRRTCVTWRPERNFSSS